MRILLLSLFIPVNLWAQTIVYTTDLEGYVARWKEVVARSEAFEINADRKIVIKPGYHYVYGGDILDRSPGHLELLEDHVSLAEHQPDQTTFITGNRDLNKLPLRDFADDPTGKTFRSYLGSIAAPALLENQRLEMGRRGEPATPADVRRGLTKLVQPEGLLQKYLLFSQPAKIMGDTLFVHGAWKSTSKKPVATKVEQINTWYKRKINDWATANGIWKSAYNSLMEYQSSTLGVIYADYSDAKWNPTLPNSAVRSALLAAGIKRVVVGHRSYGETPAILRGENIEVIFADNSSSPRAGASIVTLKPGVTRIQSTLSDGTELDFTWNVDDPAEPIGHWTSDGALIVGRTAHHDWVLFKNPGGQNFVVPQNSLRRVAGIYRIVRQTKTFDDETFYAALAIEAPIPRVDALKKWHGADLNSAQAQELIRRSSDLTNSFEFGQYIRLAGESGSAAWLPVLAKWRAAWTPPALGWHKFLLTSLDDSVTKIKCGNALEPKR